ncbi:MAG TPA: hypothetical protein VLZ03_14235 [Thermodesulfobacteriota bacterium]|nr:hypothetical protein [Thermodesulfobacteriota bacterium]
MLTKYLVGGYETPGQHENLSFPYAILLESIHVSPAQKLKRTPVNESWFLARKHLRVRGLPFQADLVDRFSITMPTAPMDPTVRHALFLDILSGIRDNFLEKTMPIGEFHRLKRMTYPVLKREKEPFIGLVLR